jgi:hypothetical protein
MADLSDASTLLVNMAAAALYPNGTGQASAIVAPVKIYPGWPISTALDADLRAGTVNVSVFPMQSSIALAPQTLDNPQVIVPPVYGLVASVANVLTGNTLTLTGTPNAGEFVTLIADNRNVYTSSQTTAAAILGDLLAQASVNYPSGSLVGPTLTIPANPLVARIGGVATLGNSVHRQKQSFMLTVWAPSEALRSAAAMIIDVALKRVNIVTFPDTSNGLLTFERTLVSDKMEHALCYRRDLIFGIEYATLDTYQGVEITTISPVVTFT